MLQNLAVFLRTIQRASLYSEKLTTLSTLWSGCGVAGNDGRTGAKQRVASVGSCTTPRGTSYVPSQMRVSEESRGSTGLTRSQKLIPILPSHGGRRLNRHCTSKRVQPTPRLYFDCIL